MAGFICRNKAELDRAAEMIGNLAPDKAWRVTVGRYHNRRSLDQNARFHAIIAAVATETGNDPSFLKEWVKAEFGPKITGEVDGRQVTLPKPSRQYDTAEMSEVMDRLEAWAATEFGVSA
jgi:hypothetical protein